MALGTWTGCIENPVFKRNCVGKALTEIVQSVERPMGPLTFSGRKHTEDIVVSRCPSEVAKARDEHVKREGVLRGQSPENRGLGATPSHRSQGTLPENCPGL